LKIAYRAVYAGLFPDEFDYGFGEGIFLFKHLRRWTNKE
jgi:hypothetical protein